MVHAQVDGDLLIASAAIPWHALAHRTCHVDCIEYLVSSGKKFPCFRHKPCSKVQPVVQTRSWDFGLSVSSPIWVHVKQMVGLLLRKLLVYTPACAHRTWEIPGRG